VVSDTFFIAFAIPWLTSWFTPLWMMGIGSLAGLLFLLVLWGILWAVAPRVARDVPGYVREGILLPILVCVLIMAAFGAVSTIVIDSPLAMLASVPRLPLGGTRTITATIPPSANESDMTRHPVPVDFRGDELQGFSIKTNEPLIFSDGPTDEEAHAAPNEIDPVDGLTFERRKQGGLPFAGDFIANFYFTNLSTNPANVTITIQTHAAYPQVAMIPITAVGVMAIFVLYVLQAAFCPKLSAIALSTVKSELAQPLFYILVILGIFLVILFMFIPYNTFGEDIKMLKDSGLTLILVLSIIQGVWAASNSVADEIEGRTALTVLSKPIGRTQFLIGKFAGILWTVGLLFLLVGLVFIVVVAYKPIFDAREIGTELPDWHLTHYEVARTVPGLVLAFFETAVLVALSVAISTRLPMLANFVICFSIYVLGHLTPLIVLAKIDFAPVVFVGNLIATVLPVLDHFNIQASIAAGKEVPMAYLGMAFFYCLLYSSIVLLLALILFEDRDLA
jgi:hypothetical protein